jgi:CheY-like chemotaxis protein
MKRLLDDLLDVSRVSQGKIDLRREPVELGAILRQAAEVSRPLITEKEQRLSLTPPAAPIMLDADPTRLVQVFANLLNNAAKYSDRGGHIEVDTGIEDREVLVRVRDNGVGMSADLIARAFDLFVQDTRSLDRAQGGLGIGLTMVRSLVKLHGGSVRAFSEGPGRGSELVVRLPRASMLPLPAASSGPHAIRPAPRSLRVLVVDDNLAAARSLGELLALLGHQVTLAHDGPDALALIAGAAPELVMVDIGLPGMDGYSVAAALRKSGFDRLALIALTGYGRDEDIARSRAAGFDHHLVKPVDLAALQRITTGLEIGADQR